MVTTRILDHTMKLTLTSAILFLTLGPAAAGPADEHTLRAPLDAVVTVMPISIDGNESRTPMHLRDALRQPFERMDDPFKPYRLSVEERQRMREQLRGQSAPTNHAK